MERALDGIRVLDLTDVKGAWATKLLADLGADVVRVEPPGGDAMRTLGPFYRDQPGADRSLTYWFYNTSKRAITLDLAAQEGRASLLRLASESDILVESAAMGYLDGLGLGYTEVARSAPGLIYVSITPFGRSGPLASSPATDLTLSAMGGMMHVTGNRETPPLVAFGQQTYHVGAHFGAINALAALRGRRASGRGQLIDVSIEASVAAFIEHVNMWYLYSGRLAKRQGSLHWSSAFKTFRASDGYVCISFFHQWEFLVAWLLSEDAADDLANEQYLDRRWAVRHLDHIIEVVGRWVSGKTVEELFREGQQRRFPWAPVHTIEQLLGVPQLRERDYWTPVVHDELGATFEYPGAPYRLSASPWAISRRPPLHDEHTREVLGG
ncbi:MAG: hypothetical protein GEU28_05820 [Dehalococcoidia bacterium]|nr:hypothetical protein [Dehalococcoidia bacterium]